MTTPITIGIDAKPLTRPLAGIGRYLREVLVRMVKDSPHHFILYSPGPLQTDCFDGLANVTIKHAHITSRIGRQIWAQTLLPLWAKRDAVDVLWCPAHGIPLLLPKRIPVIVTIHDLVWRHVPQTMRPLGRLLDTVLMPHAITRARRIITVSESTARDVLREVPTASDKICVIPLAGNLPKPDIDNAAHRFGHDYFLFVGTLEPRKNLANLLAAYANLSPAIRVRHRLVVVGGSGWGGVDVHQLIASYQLTGQVEITGWLDDAALADAYQHAYALCMPSLYEGFGLPIIEALQWGVPVVTSNLSSMPEVAGDAGLLVDPLSVDDISNALRRLAEDTPLHAQLSQAAWVQAARFSWEKTAQETQRVLLESL